LKRAVEIDFEKQLFDCNITWKWYIYRVLLKNKRNNPMETSLVALPILPGKTEELKQFVKEVWGARKKEYEASRQRQGITREYVHIQSTPRGDILVIFREANDLGQMHQAAITSKDPFDLWFQQQLFACHGAYLTEPGALMSEALLEWDTPQ
jgi:hypothetical protein